MSTYRDLAKIYKQQLEKEGEAFLFTIGKMNSIRSVLVEVYHDLVRKGECTPIEQLPEAEKLDMWEFAKKYSESPLKTDVIELCKALHGFGIFIQL